MVRREGAMKTMIALAICFLLFIPVTGAEEVDLQRIEDTIWFIDVHGSPLYVLFMGGECYFGPSIPELIPVSSFDGYGFYRDFFFFSHFGIYLQNYHGYKLFMSGWLFSQNGFVRICQENEGCIRERMIKL